MSCDMQMRLAKLTYISTNECTDANVFFPYGCNVLVNLVKIFACKKRWLTLLVCKRKEKIGMDY